MEMPYFPENLRQGFSKKQFAVLKNKRERKLNSKMNW